MLSGIVSKELSYVFSKTKSCLVFITAAYSSCLLAVVIACPLFQVLACIL